jgi:RHS repeat-associated protein
MQRMVASSIPIHASFASTRAESRAGGWIASTNELLHDSSTTTSTLTGPFGCNHQYPVTAITSSTGAIAERYAYTAYGQPTVLNASGLPLTPQSSTLSNRYSFTGREWDATLGLHHFRARWMSPSAGRFLGRDPIGYAGTEWGLYEFVRSRALDRLDPSGLVLIFCECKSPSITDFFPYISQGSGWEVPTMCNGLASTCCEKACCPGHYNPCNSFTGRWRLKNTPPPPTFPQVFWDCYSNCSRSDCLSWCTISYGGWATPCLLACIPSAPTFPIYIACISGCSGAVGAVHAPCWLSCFRCRNP